MWEYPALILGLLKRHILLGKIQEQGQSIGNFIKSNYIAIIAIWVRLLGPPGFSGPLIGQRASLITSPLWLDDHKYRPSPPLLSPPHPASLSNTFLARPSPPP
jgi:hypothetical protein